MKKRKALSAMGYAIMVVILIAIGMIVSAPFIIEQNQPEQSARTKHEDRTSEEREEIEEINPVINSELGNKDFVSREEINNIENRINLRIESIERNFRRGNLSDKYICSIEGGLNEAGIVVPIDPNNPPAKFVFACEYRR